MNKAIGNAYDVMEGTKTVRVETHIGTVQLFGHI